MSKYLKTILDEEMVAELGLRLLNRDIINEAAMMELTQDVTDFVKTLIKKRQKKAVYKFLEDHKNHLTPFMRETVSEELKTLTPGKI